MPDPIDWDDPDLADAFRAWADVAAKAGGVVPHHGRSIVLGDRGTEWVIPPGSIRDA